MYIGALRYLSRNLILVNNYECITNFIQECLLSYIVYKNKNLKITQTLEDYIACQ